MPAVTRRGASAATLGILSLLLMPGTAVSAAAPAISVAVLSDGSHSPTYRIEVRNATNVPVDTIVRQNLPRGARLLQIHNGGQATPIEAAGTEVSWRLQLPARGTAKVSSQLAAPSGGAPLAAPVCAFIGDGDMPYDCATATWFPGRQPGAAATPWWRQPAVIVGVLAALALLTAAAGWWWLRRRRAGGPPPAGSGTVRRSKKPAAPPAPPLPSESRLIAVGGIGRPRPPEPVTTEATRHAPPTWMVVGLAAAALTLLLSAFFWTGGTRVAALGAQNQPTSGAWVGDRTAGRLGQPLREADFEFTLYRLTCPSENPPAGRQCRATVGLRNLGATSRLWYAGLQRAYLPDGGWVSADEDATCAANRGQDPFVKPVPVGGHMLLPVVFTMPGDTLPTRIELRSAVFSAGVSIAP